MRCQCAAGEKKHIESQLWGMSSLMFYSAEVRKQTRLSQQLVLQSDGDQGSDDARCFKVLITWMMVMSMI